jgi:hypothetical protein
MDYRLPTEEHDLSTWIFMLEIYLACKLNQSLNGHNLIFVQRIAYSTAWYYEIVFNVKWTNTLHLG